jgi:hypothetical protein
MLRELEQLSRDASSVLVEAMRNLIMALFRFAAHKNDENAKKQCQVALTNVFNVVSTLPEIKESDARVLGKMKEVTPTLPENLRAISSAIDRRIVAKGPEKEAEITPGPTHKAKR